MAAIIVLMVLLLLVVAGSTPSLLWSLRWVVAFVGPAVLDHGEHSQAYLTAGKGAEGQSVSVAAQLGTILTEECSTGTGWFGSELAPSACSRSCSYSQLNWQ
jgi:hypothetical protein